MKRQIVTFFLCRKAINCITMHTAAIRNKSKERTQSGKVRKDICVLTVGQSVHCGGFGARYLKIRVDLYAETERRLWLFFICRKTLNHIDLHSCADGLAPVRRLSRNHALRSPACLPCVRSSIRVQSGSPDTCRVFARADRGGFPETATCMSRSVECLHPIAHIPSGGPDACRVLGRAGLRQLSRSRDMHVAVCRTRAQKGRRGVPLRPVLSIQPMPPSAAPAINAAMHSVQ